MWSASFTRRGYLITGSWCVTVCSEKQLSWLNVFCMFAALWGCDAHLHTENYKKVAPRQSVRTFTHARVTYRNNVIRTVDILLCALYAVMWSRTSSGAAGSPEPMLLQVVVCVLVFAALPLSDFKLFWLVKTQLAYELQTLICVSWASVPVTGRFRLHSTTL